VLVNLTFRVNGSLRFESEASIANQALSGRRTSGTRRPPDAFRRYRGPFVGQGRLSDDKVGAEGTFGLCPAGQRGRLSYHGSCRVLRHNLLTCIYESATVYNKHKKRPNGRNHDINPPGTDLADEAVKVLQSEIPH